MLINVINLPESTERKQSVINEFANQSIIKFELKFWNGIKTPQVPFLGISLAHKQIIRDAKLNGLKSTCVVEDDVKFTSKNSLQYYFDNMPIDFDLYLGCVYDGTINEQNLITDFYCGNILYTVHERFYDKFLETNTMNNLDRELGKLCGENKIVVCNPFVCLQHDGFSYHKGRITTFKDDYSNKFLNRTFL